MVVMIPLPKVGPVGKAFAKEAWRICTCHLRQNDYHDTIITIMAVMAVALWWDGRSMDHKWTCWCIRKYSAQQVHLWCPLIMPSECPVNAQWMPSECPVNAQWMLLHVNIANLQWHSLGIHCWSPMICRFMAISSSDDKPGARRRRRATTSLRSLWGFVSTVKAGALGPDETPLKRAATGCPLRGATWGKPSAMGRSNPSDINSAVGMKHTPFTRAMIISFRITPFVVWGTIQSIYHIITLKWYRQLQR